ncbi:RNA-binding ATPase activator esf2 [Taxawa tesnikishii (nom. ined.)]|nr:RNA-binding ATPase activator esf2 [Dothideales sp. JES 119]
MATRKRNEWLDADESDEEQGYDSEEQQESRGALAGRSIKRRRVSEQPEEDSEAEEGVQLEGTGKFAPAADAREEDLDEEDDVRSAAEDDQDPEDGEEGHGALPSIATAEKTVKPLTAKQLAASQKAVKKTGVIYLSRIPPFMKPATLKHFLSPTAISDASFSHPKIQQLMLAECDAKIVAETLNGNIVGGKKGNFYHDDVWNIKYLKGFKWHHLTEQIANENAERAARLRAEITKKRAKMEKVGSAGDVGLAAGVGGGEARRQFKQNQVKMKGSNKDANTEQPEAVRRVLSKIF